MDSGLLGYICLGPVPNRALPSIEQTVVGHADITVKLKNVLLYILH